MSNTTLNYLFATRPLCVLGFSGTTATSSVHLAGPGGQSGDGFPMPRDGILTGLRVWDGSSGYHDLGSVSFSAGDRVCVYCQTTGSDFTVKVRLNGISTVLQTPSVPHNSTLFAVVEFTLHRE